MAVLIGIDEAGFGPLLGPLVVSSASFSVPDGRIGDDLWECLRASVCSQRRRMNGRLLITDSKKAYTRSSGLQHLERTVLAVLNSLGQQPAYVREVLEILCLDGIERFGRYPWYRHLETISVPSADPDKAIAASAFLRDLTKQQMGLLEIASVCLDVVHYNQLVGAMRNKSNVLFGTTCRLIQRGLERYPDQALTFWVDRQGGRIHYRAHLQRMFPQWSLSILEETENHSHYQMTRAPQRVDLHFLVKGDQRQLPVALASMASKYVRELLILALNNHFSGFIQDLKPTAGYWQDGLRFIKDLADKCPQAPQDYTLLVRSR